MASIDMASLSLDEIIQKNRSGGRKSGGSGGGGFGGRRRSGPAGARKAIDKGQKVRSRVDVLCSSNGGD